MPTYVYKCKKCKKEQEEYMSINTNFDEVTIRCNSCKGLCIKQISSGLPPVIDTDTPYRGN